MVQAYIAKIVFTTKYAISGPKGPTFGIKRKFIINIAVSWKKEKYPIYTGFFIEYMIAVTGGVAKINGIMEALNA